MITSPDEMEPPKITEGGGNTRRTISPRIAKCTASSPSSVQEKIAKFEEKQKGGPPKKPQQPKKLQVKTRKWVKKKNGLFGWITSVGGPGKSEVPPKLGGGDKIK